MTTRTRKNHPQIEPPQRATQERAREQAERGQGSRQGSHDRAHYIAKSGTAAGNRRP